MSAVVWHRRAALMYTVGAWTVFGFVAYRSVRLFEKDDGEQEQPREPDTKSGFFRTTADAKRTETVTYGSPAKGFYITTTATYKPDFVPYSTRLQNYVQSFFDGPDGKEK